MRAAPWVQWNQAAKTDRARRLSLNGNFAYGHSIEHNPNNPTPTAIRASVAPIRRHAATRYDWKETGFSGGSDPGGV